MCARAVLANEKLVTPKCQVDPDLAFDRQRLQGYRATEFSDEDVNP
jgi:hypothetical protein